ncbi:hypothetical protein [Candidatus Formimonas warabiya]|uniref:MalT-like winged helix domain-containing protein n=1 Tax=Formimonas warabiya TaxID=1761012 RepID=A0A3G1KMD9_FORW1|nr:hypothetical protein [Candidatus Formimonas warabiya]ATW23613.1 hypothetical protein DCMF_01295 [Candidatus Formimonas warabiya]
MKYLPENVRLCLGSREIPWPGLAALRARGKILELTQKEMQFTKDEAARFIGFDDDHLYALAEGWPLAFGSFKVLFQNGISPGATPSHGHDTLYEYLLHECILRLAPEVVDFLHTTACFEELDAPMLNAVLGIQNARLILDSLAARNIFTIRTSGTVFRYHALFTSKPLPSAMLPKRNIQLF